MKEEIEKLASEVKGQSIYVIGGGTSFDHNADYFKKIPKDRAVVLNSNLKFFDSCLLCMFMDSSWQRKNKRLLNENRQKYAIRVNLDKRRLTPYKNDNIMYLKNGHISKCSFEPSYRQKKYDLVGNNVGVCAIDLLDQMEAKKIYLLGFDCSSNDDTKSHCHNEYSMVVKQKTYNEKLIPCFDALFEHLKRKGTHLNVINLSPTSKITSITRKSLEGFEFP